LLLPDAVWNSGSAFGRHACAEAFAAMARAVSRSKQATEIFDAGERALVSWIARNPRMSESGYLGSQTT